MEIERQCCTNISTFLRASLSDHLSDLKLRNFIYEKLRDSLEQEQTSNRNFFADSLIEEF